MALVSYSDSEGSSEDEKSAKKAPTKASAASTKPTFQKVIDRSNPHKIKINLPEPTRTSGEEEKGGDEPPLKRAKLGSSSLSSFNSFLPAPKRTATTNGLSNVRKAGLGSGVNLKTGATPGFSREPMEVPEPHTIENAESGLEGDDGFSGSTENANAFAIPIEPNTTEVSQAEPKKQGNPMMFKPLSVTRKPQKKKKANPAPDQAAESSTNPESTPSLKAPLKVSLFSLDIPAETLPPLAPPTHDYQPMIHLPPPTTTSYAPPPSSTEPYNSSPPPQTETLTSIAASLHLSPSATRQLLGRAAKNPSLATPSSTAPNIQIKTFSTDAEYASNELLRQAGETVSHNPVRALAAGKHSLKQLIGVASGQKEALEEHFAAGRRNKREAGSKYGW